MVGDGAPTSTWLEDADGHCSRFPDQVDSSQILSSSPIFFVCRVFRSLSIQCSSFLCHCLITHLNLNTSILL
ncbi:hypothetical protein L2E82_49491 [Cichorium intybus]|uniref:Uncharacterized protein n=1 Tax=Cichorium intybus TaxID=13427 RepID=A0ACB8Z4V1_CICIN|nr:hypothetical protein L2E82_49491 [Cichorium intybus]